MLSNHPVRIGGDQEAVLERQSVIERHVLADVLVHLPVFARGRDVPAEHQGHPAKGEGEGKASLVGTVTLDPVTKTMTLEQYEAQPVTLRGVKVSAES